MKRLLALCMTLLLLLLPALAARAEGNMPPLVVDDAGLLTDEEFDALFAYAEEVSIRQAADVAIVTVNGLNGREALDYAADYYDYNGYGQGEDHDGLMLLLSMRERAWAIVTTGWAIDVFTDRIQREMEEAFLPYLSDGEYYTAFNSFVSMADMCMTEGNNWDFDDGSMPMPDFEAWEEEFFYRSPLDRTLAAAPIVAIAALIITGVVLGVMYSHMKTARSRRGAANYVRSGSMNVTRSREIFLYHTQTRVKVESDSDSRGSSGGSSTFTSSSGTSHGGSSGHF